MDTLLVEELGLENKKELKKFITDGEGQFSMYIDAVKMTMECNSYDVYRSDEKFDEDWLEKYQSY